MIEKEVATVVTRARDNIGLAAMVTTRRKSGAHVQPSTAAADNNAATHSGDGVATSSQASGSADVATKVRQMSDAELAGAAQKLGYPISTWQGQEERRQWEEKVIRLLGDQTVLEREDQDDDGDEMLIDIVEEFFDPPVTWDIDSINFQSIMNLFPQNSRNNPELLAMFDRMCAVRKGARDGVSRRVHHRYVGVEFERRVAGLEPHAAAAALDKHVAQLESELAAEEKLYSDLAATAEIMIATAQNVQQWRLGEEDLDTSQLRELESRVGASAPMA